MTTKRILCIAIILLTISATYLSTAQASTGVSDSASTFITLTVGSPYMTINGVHQPIDNQGSVPIIRGGRTLVPVRAIFEALSVRVSYSNRVITGTLGNTVIKLTIGSTTAFVNDRFIRLDVAPIEINGRTMVPLRFIAESLGANVAWKSSTQTVEISQVPLYVELGGVRISLGDTLSGVQRFLGAPTRVDPSHCDFSWHVYVNDYSRFLMVGINNEQVVALYTNSRGFVTNNARYGDTRSSIAGNQNITLYYDSNDGNRAHAVLILSSNVVHRNSYDSAFYSAQERQNFDATNTFRVNHGIPPLAWDDIAARTARQHCQDMADRGYFNHSSPEGTTAQDRFKRNGGSFTNLRENLSAGHLLGIASFNAFVNSANHRVGMLNSNLRFLGVGYAQSISSQYRYHLAQLIYS